ncbi:MAG: 30S ribosomal protein S9 [Phycisphaeraceae bacterium]
MAQPAKPDKGGFVWGTGRRKSAIARVRVKPGSGKFLVNNREVDNFFSEQQHREQAQSPLKTTKTDGKLDVLVKVHGGGITGQAGAVLLGVARALLAYDPSLEPVLREHGYLTRDPREVERKKYGQAGARRRFQFSKR